jgi:hypothetical protein
MNRLRRGLRALFLGGVSGAAPAGPTSLVRDLFTGADGTELASHTPDVAPVGASWVQLKGNAFRILSNACASNATRADDDAAAIDAGAADCVITCDCQKSGGGAACLIARATDATHWWSFLMFSGSAYIQEKNTTYVNRASKNVGLAATATYPIEITLAGNVLTMGINNDSLSYTSAYNNTATKHGLRLAATVDNRWDNYEVAP